MQEEVVLLAIKYYVELGPNKQTNKQADIKILYMEIANETLGGNE